MWRCGSSSKLWPRGGADDHFGRRNNTPLLGFKQGPSQPCCLLAHRLEKRVVTAFSFFVDPLKTVSHPRHTARLPNSASALHGVLFFPALASTQTLVRKRAPKQSLTPSLSLTLLHHVSLSASPPCSRPDSKPTQATDARGVQPCMVTRHYTPYSLTILRPCAVCCFQSRACMIIRSSITCLAPMHPRHDPHSSFIRSRKAASLTGPHDTSGSIAP